MPYVIIHPSCPWSILKSIFAERDFWFLIKALFSIRSSPFLCARGNSIVSLQNSLWIQRETACMRVCTHASFSDQERSSFYLTLRKCSSGNAINRKCFENRIENRKTKGRTKNVFKIHFFVNARVALKSTAGITWKGIYYLQINTSTNHASVKIYI